METVLEGRGLQKAYRDDGVETQALRGLDIAVRRGEFLAVMGPSGCGKTTLLNLLGALDSPTSGEVLFDGEPMSSMSDRALTRIRRRRIGFVFQFFNLIPVLTVEENIAFPARLDGRGDLRPGIDRLLDALGLGDLRGKLPAQLSGGERQRVAVARALVMEPEVVLADEPTGNIDTVAAGDLLGLLGRLHEDGQTIVLVTHDPTVASVAERVVFMRDGRLVEEMALPGTSDPASVLQEVVRLGRTDGD